MLEPGDVAAGDPISREGRGDGAMSVREVARLLSDSGAVDDLDRAAALPALAIGWREGFANRAVASAGAAPSA